MAVCVHAFHSHLTALGRLSIIQSSLTSHNAYIHTHPLHPNHTTHTGASRRASRGHKPQTGEHLLGEKAPRMSTYVPVDSLPAPARHHTSASLTPLSTPPSNSYTTFHSPPPPGGYDRASSGGYGGPPGTEERRAEQLVGHSPFAPSPRGGFYPPSTSQGKRSIKSIRVRCLAHTYTCY